MDPAAAAELKTVLVGAPLPARKPDLLEYAVRQRAEPPLLDALGSLPDETAYESLDEVVEELLHVQPHPGGGSRPERGPDPGTMRP